MGTEDEATFGLMPIIARGWARKGSRPVAKIDKKPKAINVFAIRTKKAFTYSFSKRKKQRDFTRFLDKALKKFEKLLLFIDGAPGHRGKIVYAYLAKRREVLKIVYFPAYTPELNPSEQCWKPARKRLAGKTLHTIVTLQYHVRQTFNDPKNLPKMFTYFGD